MNYECTANRRARVDKNRAAGKPFAVFMFTSWFGPRWHYDGYTDHATEAEAFAARDAWLAGAPDPRGVK
jgi:hypothetical protein